MKIRSFFFILFVTFFVLGRHQNDVLEFRHENRKCHLSRTYSNKA